jgi:hypothetical protein
MPDKNVSLPDPDNSVSQASTPVRLKTHAGARARVASVDWAAAKKAFIERPERPLIDDLAREFGVNATRMARACSDEGWPLLRAQKLEQALRSSDAAKALMEAAAGEGAVQRAATNLALEMIGHLHEVARQAAAAGAKAENTRANTLNTLAFALRNLTGALKDAGIIGLPRSLKSAVGVGDEGGKWNPAMLASLNVTVQNLVSTASPAAPQAPSSAVSGPIEAEGGVQPPPALADPVSIDLPLAREAVAADVI